ncbi:hypothetical protein BC829DRAFT_397645 [Chytridium lagenaria]|nr:hypothetical protein BC829DRAFT_397645 [Chytridium lagenaria]
MTSITVRSFSLPTPSFMSSSSTTAADGKKGKSKQDKKDKKDKKGKKTEEKKKKKKDKKSKKGKAADDEDEEASRIVSKKPSALSLLGLRRKKDADVALASVTEEDVEEEKPLALLRFDLFRRKRPTPVVEQHPPAPTLVAAPSQASHASSISHSHSQVFLNQPQQYYNPQPGFSPHPLAPPTNPSSSNSSRRLSFMGSNRSLSSTTFLPPSPEPMTPSSPNENRISRILSGYSSPSPQPTPPPPSPSTISMTWGSSSSGQCRQRASIDVSRTSSEAMVSHLHQRLSVFYSFP